jgi:hypothetical protein
MFIKTKPHKSQFKFQFHTEIEPGTSFWVEFFEICDSSSNSNSENQTWFYT